MNWDSFLKLAPGVYRVHWASGGSSAAALGVSMNGLRWLAPVNFIEPLNPVPKDLVAKIVEVEPMGDRLGSAGPELIRPAASFGGLPYQRRPMLVEARQFDPDVQPWPTGVQPAPCYCFDLAQDGRRCPNHPARNGLLYRNNKMVAVESGNWVVWIQGQQDPRRTEIRVYTDAEFQQTFDPLLVPVQSVAGQLQTLRDAASQLQSMLESYFHADPETQPMYAPMVEAKQIALRKILEGGG